MDSRSLVIGQELRTWLHARWLRTDFSSDWLVGYEPNLFSMNEMAVTGLICDECVYDEGLGQKYRVRSTLGMVEILAARRLSPERVDGDAPGRKASSWRSKPPTNITLSPQLPSTKQARLAQLVERETLTNSLLEVLFISRLWVRPPRRAQFPSTRRLRSFSLSLTFLGLRR